MSRAAVVALWAAIVTAHAGRSQSDQVIAAVLGKFAHDTVAGERVCVMPTLRSGIDSPHTTKRPSWGAWLTLDDRSVPRKTALALDRALATARVTKEPKSARIGRTPNPLILAAEDGPTHGPCSINDHEGEVWQLALSLPRISGNFAFVEASSVVHGTNPPPQLLVIEFKAGRWVPLYEASRWPWYD